MPIYVSSIIIEKYFKRNKNVRLQNLIKIEIALNTTQYSSGQLGSTG